MKVDLAAVGQQALRRVVSESGIWWDGEGSRYAHFYRDDKAVCGSRAISKFYWHFWFNHKRHCPKCAERLAHEQRGAGDES